MKLKTYLANENMTQSAYIAKTKRITGVCIPQGTLAKWILEVRIPRKEQMENIYHVTDGKVEPNDFYNLEIK